MKKPTLRLRQVFEGPTHFKVVKPLGNPIKIAKKGLSPNLMGRLRKFARNGEVTEPVQSTDDEVATTDQMKAQALTPPGGLFTTQIPVSAGEGSFGVPALPAESSDSDLEIPQPIDAAEPIQPVSPRPRPKRPIQPEPVAVVPAADVIEPSVAKSRPRPRQPDAVEPVVSVEEVAPAESVAVEAKPAVPVAKEPAPAEPSPFERALGLVNFDFAKYEAASPEMKPIIRQAAQAAFAAKAVADADVAAAEAETSALADEQKAQKEELARLQESAKRSRDIQEKILSEYDYLKDPTSYLGSMSTLGQIGTAISLAAGAFASGMTGMPNFAQKIYDNAIEQDLQAQKRRADSLYQRLVNAGSSVENAENMVRAQLKLVGAAEQTRRAAEIKLPQVKAKIQSEAAKQALDATSTMQRIARDQAKEAREASLAPLRERELKTRVGEAEAEAGLRPLKKRRLEAEVAIAELTPKKLKQEMNQRREDAAFKREKAEQDRQDRKDAAQDKADQKRIARELTLGDVNLELKTDQRAPLIREGISQRAQALESLLKLEALLTKAKDGYELWKPGSNTRNAAIAELNFAIENFPKGAGFGRAISVAAKELIAKAIQEPTSYKSLFKQVFLDKDPAMGIKILRQEVARNFEEEIAAQSRNTRPEIKSALDSWYKSAEDKIKRYETEMTADEEL